MKKKKTQEKEQILEKSIKEIETKEEKNKTKNRRKYKIPTRKKYRINFITRKKDGRSSIEVKCKMGC